MSRFISLLCLQTVLLVISIPASAKTTDSTSIRISVEHKKQVMLRGSALDSDTKKLVPKDINAKKKFSLGSLGLRSNVGSIAASNCEIGFETKNNFRLKQLNKANTYLARYKIAYDGKVIEPTATVQTTCNFNAKDLSLVSFDMLSTVSKKGLYQDTITVLLTVP